MPDQRPAPGVDERPAPGADEPSGPAGAPEDLRAAFFMPVESLATKVAGVMSDRRGPNGAPLRQAYLQKMIQQKITRAQLRPDPTNPHDPDAIAVVVRLGVGAVTLGYLPNRDRICLACGAEYPVPDGHSGRAPTTCGCGETLARNGVATRIRMSLDRGLRYSVACKVTGGQGVDLGGRPFGLGCNLRIQRISG